MEDPIALDGFDVLLSRLDEGGSPRLSLPLLEEPMRPAEYVRVILQGARDEGWTFEEAWTAAVNRLQPPQAGGAFEDGLGEALREERSLIEENRPMWQAAYEGREVHAADRSHAVFAFWTRDLGAPTGGRRARPRKPASPLP